MKSAQHHYAQTAYEGIMEVKGKSEMGTNSAFASQYGQLCHRFPSLVLTNGLRLAVAFFKAKGGREKSGSAYLLYLQQIGQAVGHDFGADGKCALSQTEYLHLSRKVLGASVWFKRYAEAVLKVEQGAPDMEFVNEGLEDAAEEVQP